MHSNLVLHPRPAHNRAMVDQRKHTTARAEKLSGHAIVIVPLASTNRQTKVALVATERPLAKLRITNERQFTEWQKNVILD